MTNEGAKREIEAEWERMNDDEERAIYGQENNHHKTGIIFLAGFLVVCYPLPILFLVCVGVPVT